MSLDDQRQQDTKHVNEKKLGVSRWAPLVSLTSPEFGSIKLY